MCIQGLWVSRRNGRRWTTPARPACRRPSTILIHTRRWKRALGSKVGSFAFMSGRMVARGNEATMDVRKPPLHEILYKGAEVAQAGERIKRALEAVRVHLGMEVAYVSEFIDERAVFREVDAPGLEAVIKVGDSLSLDDIYCRHILAGRLPQLMGDTSTEAVAMALPITTAVPIRQARERADTPWRWPCLRDVLLPWPPARPFAQRAGPADDESVRRPGSLRDQP